MTVFEERFRELRQRFVARSRSDQVALKAAVANDDRSKLQRIAHSLAGNGGLFGFPEISLAGQRLEDALDGGAEENLIKVACQDLLARLEALDQLD